MRRTFSGHTICSSRLSNSSVSLRARRSRRWLLFDTSRMSSRRPVLVPKTGGEDGEDEEGEFADERPNVEQRHIRAEEDAEKSAPFWLFLRTTRRHATWSRALWQELCELTGLDDTACRFLSAQPWPPRRVVLHFCDQKSAECSIGSVYCRHPRGDRLRRSASGPLQSKAPQDLSDLRMIQQVLI